MKRLITLTAIALSLNGPLGSSLAQERQTMFNVGSYKLYLACEGAQTSAANASTVLLATGFGRGSDDLWAKVTPGVTEFARNLRCPWAGVFFHPYLLEAGYSGIDKVTPASFEKLITDIQAMGYKFVNPATVTQ